MRQMSVISGHPISTGFRRLRGCQRDPRNRGVTQTLKSPSRFSICEPNYDPKNDLPFLKPKIFTRFAITATQI